MQTAPTQQALCDGMNVAGYFTGELGVGAAARGYVRALEQAGVPLALNNVEIGVQSRKGDSTFGKFAQNNPYPINLICVNAGQLPGFVQTYGEDYFRDKYNIAVWWWELQEFPTEYWQCFTRFDEIWTGTRFIQHALSRYSPIPILCIPPSLSLPDEPLVSREALGLPHDEYLFLFMFDFLSVFERKNPLALIRAFRQAFQPSEPVRLILKCMNSQQAPEQLARINEASGDARITLLDKYLSRIETVSLIGACDAYASLHRSEGLGLPLAEAMMLRKPVVATGWSGNADFMTDSNSYVVPYKLVANERDAGPYKAGEVWAQADNKVAARMLREVYDNRDGSALKAAQAAVDVRMHFGPETVAAEINSRLTAIKAFHPKLLHEQQGTSVGASIAASVRASVETSIDASSAASAGTSIDASSAARDVMRHARTGEFLVDPLVDEQLNIISGTGTTGSATERSKGLLRKLIMPIVERAGYMNSIYAQLLRKLFERYGHITTRLNLVDERTRRSIANAETRISALEEEIKRLKEEKDR
jgi:glycosyltransferase involved in cell wall biosynthesis